MAKIYTYGVANFLLAPPGLTHLHYEPHGIGKNARLRRERRAQRIAEDCVPGSVQRSTAEESSPSSARIHSSLQKLISAPLLHITLIILLCVATAIYSIESEDSFSNIVAGQLLWTTRSIPTTDPLSFTGPHQWLLNRPLPSLIFFGIHSLGGLPAI